MTSVAATYPVVVIGAGPAGLAAAANLVERGLDVVVLERGDRAGAAVRGWGHVRLFSRWAELVDPAARRLLERDRLGGARPGRLPDRRRVGRALPPAAGRRPRRPRPLRRHRDRGRPPRARPGRRLRPRGPAASPCTSTTPDGSRSAVTPARSSTPPAPSRRRTPSAATATPPTASTRPRTGSPTGFPTRPTRPTSPATAGARTAVVGAGHSALTALVALATMAEDLPGTEAVWVLRRGAVGDAFGGGDADGLPARGALGQRARQAVEAGHVRVVTGFRTAAVERHGEPLALRSEDGDVIEGLDEVIGLTGFRPDHSIMTELRLDLDQRLEAPVRLAPLIDPNVHSCGSVYPHGVAELAHESEPGVFLVGMKSYGRAPDLPRHDRLRAGPVRRRLDRRRPRLRGSRRTHPPRDRGLRRRRPLRHGRVGRGRGRRVLRPGRSPARPARCRRRCWRCRWSASAGAGARGGSC